MLGVADLFNLGSRPTITNALKAKELFVKDELHRS